MLRHGWRLSGNGWPGGVFGEGPQVPLEIYPLPSGGGPHPREMALILKDAPSPEEGDTEAQNSRITLSPSPPPPPTLTPRAWHLTGAHNIHGEQTGEERALLSKRTPTSSFSGTTQVLRQPQKGGG